MKSGAKLANETEMVIKVPARLAARLRRRLAELEIPEYVLRRDVIGGLENVLEDDSLLLSAWAYTDREQAERVARRIFARSDSVACYEMTYGRDENTVEFINPDRRTAESPEDHASRLNYLRERAKSGRCVFLSSHFAIIPQPKEAVS